MEGREKLSATGWLGLQHAGDPGCLAEFELSCGAFRSWALTKEKGERMLAKPPITKEGVSGH